MRILIVLGVVLAAVMVVGGTGLAGHIASDVKSYTGCLASNDGVVTKIKEGNAPKSACANGQTQVHLSGGDLTAINAQAGGGLVGGGDNGAVSLSIRRDCAADEVVKWNGSAWACSPDANSTYTAGTGLDLNGSEFSIEESYRLPQNCGSAEAAIRNPAVGGGAATWACGQFATAGQACASGQFARGITAVGALSCAAPPGASGLQIFKDEQDNTSGQGIQDDGNQHTFASLSLPAGTYLVIAKGTITSELNVSGLGVECSIEGGGFSDGLSLQGGLTDQTLDTVKEVPFAFSDVGTLATGATVELGCLARQGEDGVGLSSARIVALKVG